VAVDALKDIDEVGVSGKGLIRVRERMKHTVLVVDEAPLACTEQMRKLLTTATALWLPRVVLVGDEKQLDGVDAGKPFSQLRKAGMATAVMDDILRQKTRVQKRPWFPPSGSPVGKGASRMLC